MPSRIRRHHPAGAAELMAASLPEAPGDRLAHAIGAAAPMDRAGAGAQEHRLEMLIDRLPERLQKTTRWLRRPASRWVRIPAGALLVGGGLLSILPLLGLWMLPLGLMLLAEDLPPLRRGRDRMLDRLEQHRPHWFAGRQPPPALPAPPNSAAPGESPVAGAQQ